MRIKFGANAAGSGKRVICLSHPTNKEENELYTRARRRYGTVENHKREINSYHYPLNSSQYADKISNKIAKSAKQWQEGNLPKQPNKQRRNELYTRTSYHRKS